MIGRPIALATKLEEGWSGATHWWN